MFEQRPDEADPIDFDEFADHLVEQGQQVSPAEIHGCMCGLLAAGGSDEAEWGLDQVGAALDLVLHGELAELSLRLYRVSSAALDDEEFDFYPLLPDDEADIAVRVGALASWCRGFLAGFAGTGAGGGTLADDSAEILKDFRAIAEAEVDEESPEEESEESYAELVEYLRFAAFNVYLDSRVRGADQAGPGEGQLH
jgi:uncharacterized protein